MNLNITKVKQVLRDHGFDVSEGDDNLSAMDTQCLRQFAYLKQTNVDAIIAMYGLAYEVNPTFPADENGEEEGGEDSGEETEEEEDSGSEGSDGEPEDEGPVGGDLRPLAFSPAVLEVFEGDVDTISVFYEDDEERTPVAVTWTVADEAIATIDEGGNVTGVSAGTTTATATEMMEVDNSATLTIIVHEDIEEQEAGGGE